MPMSQISKSNKMTRIHQLCSLEASNKLQGRPKLWVSRHPPTRIFGVSGHPRKCWQHQNLYVSKVYQD